MFFNCISMGKLLLIFAFIFRVLVSIVMESIVGFEVWLGVWIRPIMEGLFRFTVVMGVLIVKERFQCLGDHLNCVF